MAGRLYLAAHIVTDVALDWSFEAGPDVQISGNDIVVDDGLVAAVLTSLFTDARAGVDDPLPTGVDPRGHWGDQFSSAPMGSLLWLYRRASITADLMPRLREIANAALNRGVVKMGLAESVDVALQRMSGAGRNALQIIVTVVRPFLPLASASTRTLQVADGIDVQLVVSIADNIDTERHFPEFED